MPRFMSLSSGSCGNCYYLEYEDASGKHAIIIDAGVSLRRFKKILSDNGLDENSFNAVRTLSRTGGMKSAASR